MNKRPAARSVKFLISAITISATTTALIAIAEEAAPPATKPHPATAATRPTNPLNAQRAYGYLKDLCAFGPRPSGSAAMTKQQAYLKVHFEKLGAKVTFQHFLANSPLGGEKVPMANVIVEWHPERKERILLCAHYDTRPLPDRDLDPNQQRKGIFLGANDGASGTAVLMELAHLVPKLDGPLGVDFILLDGEELVSSDERDPYFLGSPWFAQQYAEKPPQHKYKWGVVLDMVGETNLSIYQDRFSATWHETRPLVKSIWATAGRLGVKEFIPRIGYIIRDDHLPLRNVAKIPTCDLIDFVDGAGVSPPGYWHTTQDTPQRCSPSSLAKVGWVVYEWIKGEESAAESRTTNSKPADAGTTGPTPESAETR